MRRTLFSNLEKKDKRMKLFSVLRRKTKGMLNDDELKNILSNIDIEKQYLIDFTEDIDEFRTKSKLRTNIEIDLIKGSRGYKSILKNVILLDTIKYSIENDITGNMDICLIDGGNFTIGLCENIIKTYNGSIMEKEQKDYETEFDYNKKVCIITDFIEWDHTSNKFSRHHNILIYCPFKINI